VESLIPIPFVDIHTHVLYGLDDGAKTLEDSLAMLEMAAKGGTSDLVASPHSDLTYRFEPKLIAERLEELKPLTGDRIQVHCGCDFHLHFDNIQDCLENPFKYTINHLRYLLVEFADQQIAKTTEEVFERMVRADITPVITHPERNPLLQRRMDEMANWIRMGCLVQVTAQSFLNLFGKQARRTADELMERRMVHFIASDAHDTTYRTPLLVDAYDYVAKRYGDATARALFCEHPRATLTGEYLEVEEPAAVKKRSWFWMPRSR
jgi:protein-tyrosine phosphatase